MVDKSVTKVDSESAPQGDLGQKYLAAGTRIGMRLWENESPQEQEKGPSSRDYETVGYVIAGRAELELEGQTITLEQGNSWVIPRGASHRYKILEAFTAVEATSPPAFTRGCDDHQEQYAIPSEIEGDRPRPVPR